jgi:hypothetical protein
VSGSLPRQLSPSEQRAAGLHLSWASFFCPAGVPSSHRPFSIFMCTPFVFVKDSVNFYSCWLFMR